MRKLPSFFALRAFESAARLNSFSLASQELHLTPSAISHQVRSLEDYFGRPLFRRSHRRIDLTPDGAHLYASLSAPFDAIEAACAELGRQAQQRSLAVHCAPSFAAKWLGPRLPDFMQRHPSITIRLSSDAEPVDLLRNESLDIAIVYGAARSSAGMIIEPLGEEDIIALCTPAVASAFDPDDPRAIAQLTLIDSSVSPVRWTEWFALNGLAMPAKQARPSFDRGALAVSAARQGLGIALESRRFADEELAKGDLVELGHGRFRSLRRQLHFLCYRASQKRTSRIMAFRAWLVEHAAAG
jgi:DNA-binding transcriptional LysR family regulator